MKKKIVLLGIAIMVLFLVDNIRAYAGEKENPENPVVLETKAEGGSEKLTRRMFLEKVWDYEKLPKEFKFKGDKPALIDFYADWCGPCRIAGPILEEVAREYEGKITVYKVNTQYEQELASVFGIRGIPAFLYIPMKGKPVMTSGIAQTEEDTKNMFIQNINKLLLAE